MTDHHDFADHFGDDHHDPLPFDDHQPTDDHVPWDDHQVELPGHLGDDQHDPLPFDDHHVEDVPEDHPAAEPPADGADLPDLPDAQLTDTVFPPSVDVGELPEPVDGFPWIDTGSLGLADIQAALHDAGPTDPVQPAELAEYAGTDLPPGADPWATLAESDDPATAALAKWWSQQN